MSRVLEYISSQPWAITPEGLRVIQAIAAREEVRTQDIEGIGRDSGRPLNGNPAVQVREGVAVIPVAGPIFRYANLFTRISGATSLEVFAANFGEALDDPTVRAIVIDVNSPGGELNGVEETAKLISSARGEKPLVALVSGLGTSAAYWLASAAESVLTVETGVLGSIGTVIALDVRTDENKIEIVSSQSPRKRPDPTAPEGRAEIQSFVDSLAQVFIENIAANRSLSAEQVLGDFGQGGVLVGAAAVEAGMADGIATLESLVSEFSGGATASSVLRAAATAGGRSANPSKGNAMAEDPKTPAATLPVIDRAYLDANHPTLVASIFGEGKAEGVTEGTTSERGRILEVHSLLVDEKGVARAAARGFESVVMKAMANDGQSKAETALELIEARAVKDEATKAERLETLKADDVLGSPGPSAETEDDDAAALADRALAVHRTLRGEAVTPSQN